MILKLPWLIINVLVQYYLGIGPITIFIRQSIVKYCLGAWIHQIGQLNLKKFEIKTDLRF